MEVIENGINKPYKMLKKVIFIIISAWIFSNNNSFASADLGSNRVLMDDVKISATLSDDAYPDMFFLIPVRSLFDKSGSSYFKGDWNAIGLTDSQISLLRELANAEFDRGYAAKAHWYAKRSGDGKKYENKLIETKRIRDMLAKGLATQLTLRQVEDLDIWLHEYDFVNKLGVTISYENRGKSGNSKRVVEVSMDDILSNRYFYNRVKNQNMTILLEKLNKRMKMILLWKEHKRKEELGK